MCDAGMEDSSKPNELAQWKAGIPPALVTQTHVLVVGIFIFALASICPPLILVLAYLLSILIPYSFRVNDSSVARRILWKRDFHRIKGIPTEWKDPPDDIVITESYWENSRGMLLLTSVMAPKNPANTKAVVCFCHGYIDNASYMKRMVYQRLVKRGIAVVTIEYEGHGRSDGWSCLIPSWDVLIEDTATFFKEKTDALFPGKKRFLLGESMGGAVAYFNYNANPSMWSGVVFVCPMCKISDSMLPPKWVLDFFLFVLGESGTVNLIGLLPIAPTKGNMHDLAFKLMEKRIICTKSPFSFGRNPRLATARELVMTTRRISESIKDFNGPFLVQHGLADRVTDPMLSQALFDEASSKDKTIKLYEGMWHTLTSGEPDENIDIVCTDSVEWILARV